MRKDDDGGKPQVLPLAKAETKMDRRVFFATAGKIIIPTLGILGVMPLGSFEGPPNTSGCPTCQGTCINACRRDCNSDCARTCSAECHSDCSKACATSCSGTCQGYAGAKASPTNSTTFTEG
ncbi:MAG: Cys-Xaa-Xaa-Xaa repeat radical SAM target protein [Negativicutes bacterium]|nr:Cys-Xaa-Xaa-Xaa repeat radical SAM target protein [Negativicutes bacterium]